MRKQTALWTTKDGKRLRICDMTDTHLNNTIALLERKASQCLSKELSAAYSISSMLHGEMAQMLCEQDIERMEEELPEDFLYRTCPIYNKLTLEKERRGL